MLYHRDGEARHDGNKRRRGNRIPTAFEPQVRAWYEEDRAAGHEFVFHRRDGARYGGRSLGRATFKRIVEDAAVEMARVPHHFKDLFVQLADEAGMERDVAAAHADTTAKTLGRKYGEPVRTAFLDRAAEEARREGLARARAPQGRGGRRLRPRVRRALGRPFGRSPVHRRSEGPRPPPRAFSRVRARPCAVFRGIAASSPHPPAAPEIRPAAAGNPLRRAGHRAPGHGCVPTLRVDASRSSK
ncbi:hypothetical protein ACVOMS_21400 [Bradyrhizobium guangxiense]